MLAVPGSPIVPSWSTWSILVRLGPSWSTSLLLPEIAQNCSAVLVGCLHRLRIQLGLLDDLTFTSW